MRHALLLFVDGVGLGPEDPAVNPLVAVPTPALDRALGRRLAGITGPVRADGALLLPLDATLGVDGLPQSATGQTALLTGINAPREVGRHVTAYPTVRLKEMLAESNLFGRVRRAGGTVALANAYTPEYFTAVEAGQLRHGAFTYAAMSAGVRLRGIEDLRAGQAIFHDLTNTRPRAWGYDVPLITPHQAGINLGRIARGLHLTVFEFFLTDMAAHRRGSMEPPAVVALLDALIGGILAEADRQDTLLLMVSDHGNIEDDRERRHTRNPVPALLVGEAREAVGAGLRAITDVAPALVRWLEEGLRDG